MGLDNPGPSDQSDSDLVRLQTEVQELQRELEEQKNLYVRVLANFDNYRKRAGREAEAADIRTRREILLDLLRFADFFEQARHQITDPSAADGVGLMARQFREFLGKQGVRVLNCLGRPFDPAEQEGVGYKETTDYPEGCVAEELNQGYSIHDELLRPARVLVARKPVDGEGLD